jgi:hypothetical protein
MSSDYDGSNFCALDSEAVSGDQPLDTFLDNALRSNGVWLASRGSQVTWAPHVAVSSDPSDGTGARPYASADWSSVLNVPWLIQPHLRGVTVAGVVRSAGEDGSTPSAAPLVTTRLQLPALGLEREESVTNTESTTPQFIARTFGELEVPQEVVAPFVTDLRLEARSRSYGPPLRTYTAPGTLPNPGALIAVAGTYDDASAGMVRPNDDTPHLFVTDVPDSEGVRHDHLAAFGGDTVLVRTLGGRLRQSGPSGELRRLSYLQVRSLELTERYDGAEAVLSRGRYRPGRVVEGADEIAHALVNRRVHDRARCIWVGPRGHDSSDTIFNRVNGYGPRFARLSAEPDGSPHQWFRASGYLDRDNGAVRMLVNALPTHASHSGGILTMEGLREASATAVWVFELEVLQYQDGALEPVVVGGGSVELELTHWPLESSGTWAALASERWLEVNKAAPDESHPYKEGQLFAEDYGLLQLVDVRAPVTLSGSSDTPVMLRMVATLDTSSVRFGSDNGDTADLRLTNTGATAWEVA